jgi:large subunit ribosomal protein L31
MKKDIHPAYRPVIFEDIASGARFLIGSTVHTAETALWDDKQEYPKLTIEISSQSHPFYTGEARTLDKAGRVERFKQRAAKKAAK